MVPPLALAAVLLLGGALAARGQPPPLVAQYSPLCERNGQREYCAYTADDDDGLPLDGDAAAGGGRGEREAAWLVFADHSRIRVVREEQHCRNAGEARICRAWLQASPAWSRPEPALYRGRCIPGGYRHEYSSRALRLAYVFQFRPLV